MGFGNQCVEIVQRAEERMDADVVGNVVPEIGHRRRVDRRKPEGVDAEPLEVIEPAEDAAEVADAVAVAVHEGPRVDLVDDPLLPPLVFLDHDTPLLLFSPVLE